MAKKKKAKVVILTCVYGVFDAKKNELIKVSLDKEEIELELTLQDEQRYFLCEGNITMSV